MDGNGDALLRRDESRGAAWHGLACGLPSSSCATQGKAFKSNARSVCGHLTVPIRHKARLAMGWAASMD